MIILSISPLTSLEILQAKQILRESRCPNESLKNTFDRYSGFVDGKIFFDDAQTVWNDIAAQFKGKSFGEVVTELDACDQIILTVI